MVVRCLTKQIGIVLVCALALTYGSATSYADQFINVENLKADLQTRDIDRIGKTLNDVKQMKYQGQILPFLVDLWSSQKAKYPELQWEIINSDIVRVDIANVLLQAQRNGRIQINDDELYEFLAKLLVSSDQQVAQNAIWAVAGLVDTSLR